MSSFDGRSRLGYATGSFVLCFCLALGMLGSATARGQLTQGTDQGGTAFSDPANWTKVKLDDEQTTVTFLLNPCEYVFYWDIYGAARTCLPRVNPGLCDELADMGAKLEDAMALWGALAADDLTFIYGGLVAGCPDDPLDCPVDGWYEDQEWVVTRSYKDGVGYPLPTECLEAATPAGKAGVALRFFEDTGTDRWIKECDIIFPALGWDPNNLDHPCTEHFSPQECFAATTLGLAHEIGHCIGFGHDYLTRKSLDNLADELDGNPFNLELLPGRPSIMSYDHRGSIDIVEDGFYPYDQALYLYNYAEAPDQEDHFAAFGTVVRDLDDNDCTDDVQESQEVFGVAVVALEVSGSTVTPVHISMTGVDPLPSDGAFRLNHLERGTTYRLIAVDARDENQLQRNGWDWDDAEGAVPELNVNRTDLWDETHSGSAYKYEGSAQFKTGFFPKLTAAFVGPEEDDHGSVEICVQFDPSP